MRVQLLPLRHYRRGMGQDDSGFDYTESDQISPVIPTETDLSAPIAPSIPDTTLTTGPIYSGIGPAAPGETIIPTTSTDLPSLILSGALPPPSGSGLTPAQVSQLNAAGATPDQVQAILAGQASPSAVLQSLQAGSSVAATLAQLASRLTGSATPCTTATGTAGTVSGSTCIATPLSALQQATIIPGVPNWVIGGGAILLVAALVASLGGKR